MTQPYRSPFWSTRGHRHGGIGEDASAGLQPARILLMVASRHPTTGKPMGRWLPRPWCLLYTEVIQEMTQNHWPRRIRAAHPYLVKGMVAGLQRISLGPSDGWLILDRRCTRLTADPNPLPSAVTTSNSPSSGAGGTEGESQ